MSKRRGPLLPFPGDQPGVSLMMISKIRAEHQVIQGMAGEEKEELPGKCPG